MEYFLFTAINSAINAGVRIMKIYNTDFDIQNKPDNSPLTFADQQSHKIISEGLKNTNIPILSEEGKFIPYEKRKNWDLLWIVDPLDGTKEFIKKNGEFTVNIALTEKGIPILGVIYAPVPNLLYVGSKERGALKIDNASDKVKLLRSMGIEDAGIRLPLKKTLNSLKIVASRSHMNKETALFIEQQKENNKHVDIVSIGSSLKLCLIASGEADLYPRYAPTMEWDIAAGHAIIIAAGGNVVNAGGMSSELVYNKEDLLNPWFIAYAPNEKNN